MFTRSSSSAPSAKSYQVRAFSTGPFHTMEYKLPVKNVNAVIIAAHPSQLFESASPFAGGRSNCFNRASALLITCASSS